MSGATYRDSGVDIDAGEAAVDRIKPLVSRTERSGVLGGIGGFGGLFDVRAAGFENPLLVSSTDGVGTKALVATAAGRFDTIGIDLVAMCVDDLVCQGAEPLFFLDYVSVGALDPEQIEALVGGVAEGCVQAGCALIGGEMAEHPGVMEAGEFELVGFSVGAVERNAVITGERVEVGDVLIGIPSPNLRSNGFSLARRIMFDIAGRDLDDPAWEGATVSVADALLDPSVIYAPAVLATAASVDVRAIAHITGGGLPGNLNRVCRRERMPASIPAPGSHQRSSASWRVSGVSIPARCSVYSTWVLAWCWWYRMPTRMGRSLRSRSTTMRRSGSARSWTARDRCSWLGCDRR